MTMTRRAIPVRPWVTAAAVERCAADLDTRDWGQIIGRLDVWPARRVLTAETSAEPAAGAASSQASADAAAALVRRCRLNRCNPC
jgi:hypothetical protein